MKFYSCKNNGVIAVISEEHAKLYATAKNCGGDPIKAGVRVFTFCCEDRLRDCEEDRFIFTGSYEDFNLLIEQGNHQLLYESGKDWSGYVPFSNYYERRSDEEVRNRELRFRTTLRDVMDVFGVQSVLNKSA
ncbi:MAG: hypothetical protein ACD_17C00032G0003 [uncultured bacterium]|nr:MAG: hypothetical protein ACD_17C00032G0003 [uncultured bacterium]